MEVDFYTFSYPSYFLPRLLRNDRMPMQTVLLLMTKCYKGMINDDNQGGYHFNMIIINNLHL